MLAVQNCEQMSSAQSFDPTVPSQKSDMERQLETVSPFRGAWTIWRLLRLLCTFSLSDSKNRHSPLESFSSSFLSLAYCNMNNALTSSVWDRAPHRPTWETTAHSGSSSFAFSVHDLLQYSIERYLRSDILFLARWFISLLLGLRWNWSRRMRGVMEGVGHPHIPANHVKFDQDNGWKHSSSVSSIYWSAIEWLIVGSKMPAKATRHALRNTFTA